MAKPIDAVNDLTEAINRGDLEAALALYEPGAGESSDILRRQADGRWLIALDNPWGAQVLTAR